MDRSEAIVSLLEKFNELAKAQAKHEIEPGYTELPGRKREKFIVDSWLRVPKSHEKVDEWKDQFTVRNPEYTNALMMGMSTRGIEEWMPLWEEDDTHLLLPRGTATRYMNNPYYELIDNTTFGHHEVDFKSKIQARDNQVTFIEKLYDSTINTYGSIGMAEPGFGI